MKLTTLKRSIGFGIVILTMFLGARLTAADAPVVYKSTPGSEIRIDGDSSAHEWYMIGSMIGGSLELPPGTSVDTSKDTIGGASDGKLDAKVQSVVAVRSVHSVAKVMPEVMDGLYQKALRETNNPKITYKLTEMKLKAGHVAGKPFDFETKGELQIAGVTNTVAMPVTLECLEGNKIRIVGSVPLKMTDFKITPPAPSFGLGLMKCKDEVKVSFKWLMVEEKK